MAVSLLNHLNPTFELSVGWVLSLNDLKEPAQTDGYHLSTSVMFRSFLFNVPMVPTSTGEININRDMTEGILSLKSFACVWREDQRCGAAF